MSAQEASQGRHARLPYGRAHGQVMVEDLKLRKERGVWASLAIMGRTMTDICAQATSDTIEQRLQPDHTLVQGP
ncbi:hypothetical protein SEA_MARGARET_60 [Gordonia phage Margaret]|nr:hypothetical protein SEA_MARGARET_60 [Gordonia phage Margaret]